VVPPWHRSAFRLATAFRYRRLWPPQKEKPAYQRKVSWEELRARCLHPGAARGPGTQPRDPAAQEGVRNIIASTCASRVELFRTRAAPEDLAQTVRSRGAGHVGSSPPRPKYADYGASSRPR